MATIKVIYNSIARRFTISPDSTWVDLETQLRNLFQIPKIPLNVSYTDEDGDAITISSDLELKEVLSQYSSGNAIKFVLTTINSEKDEETKVHDLEFHPKSKETKSEPGFNSNLEFESRPPSYYRHVTVTDEETDESFVNVNKEVHEHSETTKESSEDAKESSEESSEDAKEHEPTQIIFMIRRPWARSYYYSPQIGPFGYGFSNFYSHFFGGYPYCASLSSASPKCGAGSFRQRGQSTTANSHCSYKNSCNDASIPTDSACRRGYRNCRKFQLSAEQLSEKIETLNSMGFPSDDNAKYEDLLNRYHGNINRVIDILFREQEENGKASSSKANEMKDSAREADEPLSSTPVMVEINSENQPYAL